MLYVLLVYLHAAYMHPVRSAILLRVSCLAQRLLLKVLTKCLPVQVTMQPKTWYLGGHSLVLSISMSQTQHGLIHL